MNPTEPNPGAGTAEIAPGVAIARSALRFSASRASGPGGQNVNKRSTKVELRVALADLPLSPAALRRLVDLAGRRALRADIPTQFPAPDPDSTSQPPTVTLDSESPASAGASIAGELLITSAEHRTQLRNKQECLDRLRDLIIRAKAPPKSRRRTRPTRASKERRLDTKKRQSEKKNRRQPPGP